MSCTVRPKEVRHQDGAPPHYGISVRNTLNEQFPINGQGCDSRLSCLFSRSDLFGLLTLGELE
ncbi:hypothetical protein J6590_096030, partial [Homalodisca vitripennis]